jgi:hypothetical protein
MLAKVVLYPVKLKHHSNHLKTELNITGVFHHAENGFLASIEL